MKPLLPAASTLGRPRATDMRTVIDTILYIASTGCQWRQLPKDFPPYSTVQGYFYAWSRGGISGRAPRPLQKEASVRGTLEFLSEPLDSNHSVRCDGLVASLFNVSETLLTAGAEAQEEIAKVN